MLGKVGFENLEITCRIGTLAEEQRVPQKIFVDLFVWADFSKGAASDKVEDTIDYVAIAELCENVATLSRYHLLEKYAVDVLEAVLERFSVEEVAIRIKKPGALPGAEFCFVELSRKREENRA